MDSPFLGMIALFGFNFPPRGWAICNGQLLSISQNSALFALLGTIYGGNGVTTFGLPDLRGRVPLGVGQGPGLSNYVQGQVGGTENTTLVAANLPAHTHTVNASTDIASVGSPAGNSLGASARGGITPYVVGNANQVAMGATTSSVGSNTAINNMQPYLTMNYCIALEGIFPSRD